MMHCVDFPNLRNISAVYKCDRYKDSTKVQKIQIDRCIYHFNLHQVSGQINNMINIIRLHSTLMLMPLKNNCLQS